MALTFSEAGGLGKIAPDFSLKGVDGENFVLHECLGPVVVVFMCNHCPYVIAVQDRINALAKKYLLKGVTVVGINSNDSVKYPDDDFEAMKRRAKEQRYVFSYLRDETQEVARAYGAVCTPEFYLLEPTPDGMVFRYRGRLDDNWKEPARVKSHDLADALDALLTGRPIDADQKPSMGCSIKWK